MTRLDQTAASVLALGLALTACSGETAAADGAGVAATASATGQAPPSAASGDLTPAATPPPSSTVSASPSPSIPPDPVSIEAMIEGSYDGRDLRLGEVLVSDAAYTRYVVTYASEDLTISGVMNIPTGDGPFPTLVLNHGYIDPTVHTNGPRHDA
jgi:hypothetical protein